LVCGLENEDEEAMNQEHIISLLDERPLAELSESELRTVRGHIAACAECRREYDAAQISALLLKERAAETFEPSPFFHTRVLATLRERQTANRTWAWGRLWRAAGALASSMVVTVAALGVLTFVAPGSPEVIQDIAANSYSAEEVILNQGELADEHASDSQVLNTLYGAEEDSK
jgi:anti-sigma factor RsiW